MWQLISAALILLGPMLAIVYDGFAAYYGGRKSTITAVIQAWTVQVPELPGLFAAVMVWLWIHLFLQSVIDRVNREIPPPTPAVMKEK